MGINRIYIGLALLCAIILFISCAPNNVMTKRDDTFTFEQGNDTTLKPVYSDIEHNTIQSSTTITDYYQVGMASWYGREFQGRLTASGEPFDMNKYTAAHRTLPFGSVLIVTNLENGKKVKVTVNDRGPFKKNRILDVSYQAAKELDMLTKGEAKVGISVLSYGNQTQPGYKLNDVGVFGEPVDSIQENPTPMPKSGYDSGIAIQTGAFYSKSNAFKLKEKIQELVDKPVAVVQDGYLYKVRIIDVNKQELAKYIKLLKKNDIPSYMVRQSSEETP